MKKELLAGVAVVSTLTVGVVAQAEEVGTEIEVKNQVTQEQVDQAKETAAASQVVAEELAQQVKNQETVVAQQGELVETAKSELGQAEVTVEAAEKLAAGATVEAIDQAEKDLESARVNLTEKTEALDKLKAEAKIAEQEAAVKEQEGVVTSKEAAVAERKAELADDEAELAKAKKAVEDNVAAIKANQDGQTELTKQLEETDRAVKVAEEALEKAEAAERAKNEQLKQAEDTLKLAKANLSTKETELTQAEDQLNKAKETTKSAQEALASLEAQYGVKQTITVTDKYVELLSKYAKGDTQALIDQGLRDESVKINEINTYQVDEKGDKTTYDTQLLSKEMIADLSNFASFLINSVRERFGTIPTAVSPTSVDFVDLVTDKVIADNFQGNHYEAALTQVSNQLGLWGAGESWYGRKPNRMATLEEMRQVVYYNVVGWLTEGISKTTPHFPSQSWGHARHMTGLNNGSSAKVEYVGIDFATTGTYFDSFADDYIRDKDKVNTTIIDNKYDSSDKLLTEAKVALSRAKEAETRAQNSYTTAELERDKAKSGVDVAENKIAAIGTVATTLLVARGDLEQAKTIQKNLANNLSAEQIKLADLQKAAETLAEAVTTIEGYVKDAKAALKDSELALKTEQETLEKRRAQLDETSKKLKAAETKVSTAREAVASAEKFLSQLKDAKGALATARENLTVAQRSYVEKLAVLTKEQEQLGAKQAELSEAIRQAATDKEHYEHLLALLNQERLAAKKESIISSGQLPQEVFNNSGQLIDYIARPKLAPSGKADSVVGVVARPVTQTQAPIYSRVSRANGSSVNKLPRTNEAGTLVGLVGTVLSALGLAGLKRRKD